MKKLSILAFLFNGGAIVGLPNTVSDAELTAHDDACGGNRSIGVRVSRELDRSSQVHFFSRLFGGDGPSG